MYYISSFNESILLPDDDIMVVVISTHNDVGNSNDENHRKDVESGTQR